jgi:phage-related protein
LYNSKLGWLLPAGPLVKGILFLKKNWGEIFAFIRDTIQTVFTKITSLYNSKLGWLLPAGPLIKAILFLKNNWDEIWGGIQTKFKTVSDAVVGTFQSFKARITSIWNAIVEFIKGKAIMPIIKGMLNTMIDGLNKWIDKINEFIANIPGDFIPDVPPIPRLAAGGRITQSGSAIVGERGPELVSLPKGASVAPLNGALLGPTINVLSKAFSTLNNVMLSMVLTLKSASVQLEKVSQNIQMQGLSRGASGGGGMTINLTINGDILGMDDFESKVTSVIRDAVLGGGFSGVLARA